MSSGPGRSQSRLSNIDFQEERGNYSTINGDYIESSFVTVSLDDRKFGSLGPVMVCLVSRASVMNAKCCVTDRVTGTGVTCDILSLLRIITGIRKLPGYDNWTS